MSPWAEFPTVVLDAHTALFKLHLALHHPAWFNNDGFFRFDPPASHRRRFGVCYLGIEPLSSYVEGFGRFGLIPQTELDRRALSELHIGRSLEVADLTNRVVLGRFGITATHSTGDDYAAAQELSARLFDIGLDGIRYRIRHDPQMSLEAVALFGEPGEHSERFEPIKTTDEIPPALIASGKQFGIEVTRSAPLL